jgi:hypothetical protein
VFHKKQSTKAKKKANKQKDNKPSWNFDTEPIELEEVA